MSLERVSVCSLSAIQTVYFQGSTQVSYAFCISCHGIVPLTPPGCPSLCTAVRRWRWKVMLSRCFSGDLTVSWCGWELWAYRQQCWTSRWECRVGRAQQRPSCGERTALFVPSCVPSGVVLSWLCNSHSSWQTLLQLSQGPCVFRYGFNVASFYSVEQLWMFHCRD